MQKPQERRTELIQNHQQEVQQQQQQELKKQGHESRIANTTLLIEESKKKVSEIEAEMADKVKLKMKRNHVKKFKSCIIYFKQELTTAEDQENCDLISIEHAKQINWKESLELEKKELDLLKTEMKKQEKERFQEAEKIDEKVRAAARNLDFAQEEGKLKGVVHDMVNDFAAGDNSLNNVVKTLADFLG